MCKQHSNSSKIRKCSSTNWNSNTAHIIYSLFKIVETHESDFTCPLQCSHTYQNLKIKGAESCGYAQKRILIRKPVLIFCIQIHSHLSTESINTVKGRKWFKRILPNTMSKNSDSSTTTHSLWILISEHAKTNYLEGKVDPVHVKNAYRGVKPSFCSFLTHIQDGDISFTCQPLYCWGKSTHHPLNRRLCELPDTVCVLWRKEEPLNPPRN
jgi:hypothetical protein